MAASWDDFQGVNRGYVLELYEQYRRNPQSVDAAARDLLAQLPTPPASEATAARATETGADARHLLGAFNYVQCIRRYGHLGAHIDPLGSEPQGDPLLEPAAHNLTDPDLESLPPDLVDTPLAAGASSMADVIDRLKEVYCGTIGYDLAHIFVPEERRWLREAIETRGR